MQAAYPRAVETDQTSARMRLEDFIATNMEEILSSWEEYARTILPARQMDRLALRDHAEDILRAVVVDMRNAQSFQEQLTKSLGAGPRISTERTAAETHALLRARSGFNIEQLVAEYRALRASVLAKFAGTGLVGPTTLEEVGRFNEAVDQAIAESVSYFAAETDQWRNIFLGVLGHDLRGPLNAILMSAYLISQISRDEPVLKTTQRVVRSGERMRELLDDLLDHSRAQLGIGIPVRLEEVDIAAACKAELLQLDGALPLCRLVYEGPDRLVLCVDASRIRQVVSNLVINASKYGDVSQPITVRLVPSDDGLTIEVESVGAQIPLATSSTMFDLGQRGDDPEAELSRDSLGLGLFIVQEVAKGHGGSVMSEYRDGKNAFCVRLPVGASAPLK